MPSSIAASTARRTARVPSRWPSATGSPRFSAQRALPSRMIATLRGASGGSRSAATSDLHDFRLFVLDQVVDRLHVLVGQLLHLLLAPPLLVVADLALAHELLQVLHHVSAHVADRDLPLLAVAADDLDELLTPLLGQLRDRQPDDL